MYDAWRSDPEGGENRLRAWGLDKVLSGDIITEQNIHTLDVMNWIMEVPPLWAVGTGGRKVRPVGTCCDTFSLSSSIRTTSGSPSARGRSKAIGTKPEGIRNRMFGTEGVLETEYGGQVIIRGKHISIAAARPRASTRKARSPISRPSTRASPAASSTTRRSRPACAATSSPILGRTAAYGNRMVTWDEMLKANEKLDANLKGLKA